MQVLVRCVVFDGHGEQNAAGDTTSRITHVREGQVLGAWRAVDGRIGFALLSVTSMTMVASLLNEAFPGARHISVDEVIAVESVAGANQQPMPRASSEARQTGT